jgi:HEAT repeat protein
MKIPAYSLVVLMSLTSAAQPALAQAAAPDRAAAKASIQEALARGDTQRAYETYDGFVAASRRPDAELLSPLAADELRAIASHAVDDPRLQVEAWERLARHGDSQAPVELQRIALDRPGSPAAALADGALARLGDTTAAARLAGMASSGTLRDKSNVVEAIRRSGLTDQAQLLLPLLRDPDWATRSETADALAALGYGAAIPEIRALLDDDEPRVRAKAALALKRLKDPAADQRVEAMLRSDIGSARLDALEADPLSDRKNLAAAGRQLMNDPDPLRRVRGAEAIARYEPAAARAVLTAVAGDADSTARRLAARALASLEPPDLTILRRLLEDSTGWVRMYAAGGVLAAAAGK